MYINKITCIIKMQWSLKKANVEKRHKIRDLRKKRDKKKNK